MATIEDAIFSRLSGHVGLSALVADRITTDDVPQFETYPAITYRLVDEDRPMAMGEDAGIVFARFQFELWDKTKAGVLLVEAQFRNAMQRWRGTEATIVVQDSKYEGGVDLYRPQVGDDGLRGRAVDVTIIYEE